MNETSIQKYPVAIQDPNGEYLRSEDRWRVCLNRRVIAEGVPSEEMAVRFLQVAIGLDYPAMPEPELCPPDICEALDRYAKDRVPVGDFLRSVLENNLMDAIGRADANNLPAIGHITSYIYNRLPSPCHGSPAKYKAWLEGGE